MPGRLPQPAQTHPETRAATRSCTTISRRMSSLSPLLKHVVEERGTLTQEQGCAAVREILEGDASDIEIASLLTAIAHRGPTVDELAGFVQAMRAVSVPVPLNAARIMCRSRASLPPTAAACVDST